MSRAPPRSVASTGAPAASASTIEMPKSSSPTWMKPRAREQLGQALAREPAEQLDVVGQRRPKARSSGPTPTIVSRSSGSPRKASATSSGRL